MPSPAPLSLSLRTSWESCPTQAPRNSSNLLRTRFGSPSPFRLPLFTFDDFDTRALCRDEPFIVNRLNVDRPDGCQVHARDLERSIQKAWARRESWAR
jgi:hypothetical protein